MLLIRCGTCRRARVKQLSGVMSPQAVKELEEELQQAFEMEQAAAEVFVIDGLRVRVRVPRPIGTPLQDLAPGGDPPPIPGIVCDFGCLYSSERVLI